MSEGEGKKKGGSAGMRGKNIGGQLRALFARGTLRRKPGGGVTYKKKTDATDARNAGQGKKRAGLASEARNSGGGSGGTSGGAGNFGPRWAQRRRRHPLHL